MKSVHRRLQSCRSAVPPFEGWEEVFASVPSGVRPVITSFARRVAMVMNYQGTAAASRDGEVDNRS